jgi:hypothetical protein
MSANITNVVNVSLIPEGILAGRDNMNVVAVMTSQQGPLSSAERYRLYSSASDVATDFGTESDIAQHAKAFFAQTPNPVNFGGMFVAGYWRGAEETTVATAATLTSGQHSEATLVSELQQITDGSFRITVDGGIESDINGVDLSGVVNFEDIVAALDAAVTAEGITVTVDNARIVLTSDTTGVASTLTAVSPSTTGTYLGPVLKLTAEHGGSLVQGTDSEVLAVETKEEAIIALKAEVNIKGFVFADNPTDAEARTLASYCQANNVLSYDVFSSATNLETDATTNVVWELKLAGRTNYRMLYNTVGNRLMATAYMSRAHTVNFNAENSALTMNLKTLNGIEAEDYTQTVITKAKNVGLDIYTTIKTTPIVLTSGANDFLDNRYNLIAFIDAVQTDLFNLLRQTGTKVPQTLRGVQQLVDQAEKTSQGFVRAGVFAPGTWSSPDTFGNVDVFKRSIESRGFYWLAGRLSDQPQQDRQDRKSPILQGAVKNSGAIHSVDAIIYFNA